MHPDPSTAVAMSLDGRRFGFEAPLRGHVFEPGGYVAIGDGSTLGQVHAFEVARRDNVRFAAGEGAILDGGGQAFTDSALVPAEPEQVAAWLQRVSPPRATLTIGELALAPGVPLALDAGGFDRHTFLCGQSGSGKTYALGGVLERLLAETGLRIVILDPNSDHVRLGEVRDGAAPELAERYRAVTAGVGVRTAGGEGARRLRLRFARLSPRVQAALLRLDPITDREEYSVMLDLLDGDDDRPPIKGFGDFAAAGPAGAALGARARNLGVLDWGVWAREDRGSLDDDLGASDPRCLVVDLGSLSTHEEQALVAAATLEKLWEDRTERRPTLIVIDEAHNVCPQAAEDGLTAIAAETAVRIAAEGRKFGLHLLVSTQRPTKVHENVVSQCDNLLLMRMNSVADLLRLEALFSFVPRGLLQRAGAFRLGECIVAGKISGHPALARVGGRVAPEGGADIPADWAAPR